MSAHRIMTPKPQRVNSIELSGNTSVPPTLFKLNSIAMDNSQSGIAAQSYPPIHPDADELASAPAPMRVGEDTATTAAMGIGAGVMSRSSSLSVPSSPPRAPSPRPEDAEDGRVALLLSAAARNNAERVLKFLRSGIAPSACDYDSRTALHVAASEGAVDSVRVLLEANADVNATDRFGHTPLDEAVAVGNFAIADMLRAANAQHGALDQLESQMIQAAADNDVETVNQLLKAGVRANCADYDRRTPLHLAVSEGHADLARVLLQYGADPNAEDRWGLSPLKDVHRRLTRTGQDPMRDVFAEYIVEQRTPLFSQFVTVFIGWEVLVIAALGALAVYDTTANGGYNPEDAQAAFNNVYPLYQDVHVMIFIGFGFLMVFLRKHGYTSVGVTFLLGAFTITWYQLTHGFWINLFANAWQYIPISVPTLVMGDFCAGAVLITFGVVLGKVSPSQMLFVALSETVFYSLNEAIGIHLAISDLGGTMTIHMFGAFFGFALSKVVSRTNALGNQNNSAVYHSDIMAMLGTIFLWMFWPSFNGALGVGATQARAVINTVFSLCASCVFAFLTSHMFRREGKFSMVDIQNATLAGGVAMGACADLLIQPGSAMAIGAIAGAMSVFGFVFIQPFLETRFGLHDTCGVNNLHGIPSIIGGFAAVIAASQASASHYGPQLGVSYPDRPGRTGNEQAAYQFAYMCTSIGIGIASGTITGVLAMTPLFDPPMPIDNSDVVFSDDQYWLVPELEIPYFFDRRGEISRGKGNSPMPNITTDEMNEGASRRLSRTQSQLMSKSQAALVSKIDKLERQLNAAITSKPQSQAPLGGMKRIPSFASAEAMNASPSVAPATNYTSAPVQMYSMPMGMPMPMQYPQYAAAPPPPVAPPAAASSARVEALLEQLIRRMDKRTMG